MAEPQRPRLFSTDNNPRKIEDFFCHITYRRHIATAVTSSLASCTPMRPSSPIADATPSTAAEQCRGGTQAIVFQGGWLGLIHEVSKREKRRYYQHRLVSVRLLERAAVREPTILLRQQGG